MAKNNKLGYGEITTLILEKLADTLIESGRFAYKPHLPHLLGSLLKLILDERKKHITKNKLNRAIKNLEKRKIINIQIIDDNAYVYLEEKGVRKMAEYSLKMILDFKKKNKKWDGKWFLVFFDVPEIERRKRNYLRSFLKKLGFYQYQQSVYIYPFECEKEVVLIKNIVEGAKYMRYIIAEKIEDEKSVKTYFQLN